MTQARGRFCARHKTGWFCLLKVSLLSLRASGGSVIMSENEQFFDQT